jgi:phosphonopyruvate decarboxylase
MTREEALKVLVPGLGDHDVVVATTGFLSRELYEIRRAKKQTGEQDFYTVGSMGHASAIALGIAIVKKSRQVFCLDGDGAALMHLGSLATVG